MARISRKRIRAYWDISDSADTTTPEGRIEKGRALEDLVCYLFGQVPGITVSKRNELNEFESEEIDVAFWNMKHNKGLYFLPDVIIVECKNWSSAVGSDEVSWFDSKLRRRRAFSYGILVAANGITGNPRDKSRAHDVISNALSEGRQIVVITRAEIDALSDSSELVELIKEKICELAVSGRLFLAR
jgi:hypothetical protein